MAALKYRDEHNKVGFLEKSKGSTDYDQVIDFLLDSHIRYAIVSDPLIYDSLIKQFWSTASLLSSESGPPAIVAKIDGTPYTITESLVRSSLLLNDEGGIVDMSIAEIYTGMHNLGYPTEGKLTIHKNKFSPQWRLNFHGDPMPLLASMLAPTQPAIAGDSSREAELSVPPNVPEINEQGPFSDPNFESTSTQAHDSIPDPVPSTNVEDESLGGTFFATPPRSPAAPPKAHKLLFKEVMGKLVKRVKFLESKLKARRRNVFVSESDDEEAEEHDVDPLIKLAKAAASAADTSPIPANDNQKADIPPGASTHTTAFGSDTDVPTGPSFGFSADPFNKGKSPMVEEDPPIKQRSFRQLEEDRLGAEAAKKLYEEEQAELAREQEERQRKRQEDVLNSAKYYTDDDWIRIMGQVGPDVNEDNFAARMAAIIAERRRKFAAQSFAIYSTGWTLKYVKTFTDDQLKAEFDKIRNVAADLQAQNLRKSLKRPGADVEQPGSKKSKSSAAPQTPVPAATSTGVTPAGVPAATSTAATSCVHQSPFVDTPPHSPKASSHPDILPAISVDPTVAPTLPCATPVSMSSGPRTRSQSFDADIKTYSTKRKSLAPRKMPSFEVDLNAPDTSFITVLSDDVSDASDDDTDPLFWHIFAAWEVIPTGLGDVNALYFTDKTSKYFTHLREILHLIDRQDLSKLNGMVVKHYEVNPLAGNGLILWGDLHVLFESTTGGSSVEVWNDQQDWVIHSWKLFPFSGVHVLETFSGKILYMFADTPYPLSASLMKKMLKHKLEVEIDGIGNDMTYAVQLIQFIKNQLASCVPSA
ncbi:hypothetical protein Tco_0728455 [Tanacetum coccineum]|uniref:Xylulose kinase-1 n=1 Tax=Tanacetum coccineum TaxID=301880 RepID=A0ABQ4YL70_9ASTR